MTIKIEYYHIINLFPNCIFCFSTINRHYSDVSWSGASCVTSSLLGCHQLTGAGDGGRGTDSSQPGPVSKLHSTLSPLTLQMASDWSSGPISPSRWLTRPIRDNTRGAVPRHSHTRHNQVLSPSVAKDTLALNFPKRLLMNQNG